MLSELFYINYILILIICYLIGSFPTAYIILKKRHDKDITTEGTGNVGAMNSFDVTGSKTTGIIVFIIDFLKGLIPAFVFAYIFQFPIQFIILPMMFIIIGHNYSVWLKFKGGRGLATSAGMVVIINFWLLIIWCVVYVITNFIKKDVHISNIAATVFMPIIIIFPANFFVKFTYGTGNDSFEMLFTFCSLISLLILIRHIKPVLELIRSKKSSSSSSSS